MDNNIFDLKYFESYREDNRLEVKAANGGLPGTLWDTYSAFANTYGGCIICGVVERKDGSWKTTGLQNLSKLKKDFWNTIHNLKKVSKCLITEADTEEYIYHGDVIFVIKVPRASRSQKPIYLNNDVFGGTFRRDHEGDYICTGDEVKAMIRDSSEKSPDQKALVLTARGKHLTLEDVLDSESIRAYRIRYNTRHEGSAWSELDDTDFLIQIGAADDEGEYVKPTIAGLLMFGTERRIEKIFPEYFLDYQEHMDSNIRWTDRIYSQEPEWTGNVFDFYNRVSAKLVLDLKKPFKLVDQIRVNETPLHDAVREALVNCLVNTDFYQPWNVVIEKYPDKIVMGNPGTIIPGKKQMLKGGISQPRNKGLFKMFNLIGLGEHAGSGVPDIFKTWRDEGLKKPEVEEQFGGRRNGQPDRTILRLPLVEENPEEELDTYTKTLQHSAIEIELSIEQLNDILEFCKVPRSRAELQKHCGYKSTYHFRESVLNPLLDGGQLVRTIPDKPRSPKQKYVRKMT